MAFHLAKQATGACQPLRDGTIGTLVDAHDEQGMHFARFDQPGDNVCFWSFRERRGASSPGYNPPAVPFAWVKAPVKFMASRRCPMLMGAHLGEGRLV